MSKWRTLGQRDHSRWTWFSWESFISYSISGQISNCMTFDHCDQNYRTELCSESFICHSRSEETSRRWKFGQGDHNRWTWLYWESFIGDSTSAKVTKGRKLCQGDDNRWTALLWGSFISQLTWGGISRRWTFVQGDHRRWKELCWGIFISDLTFEEFPSEGHLVNVITFVEHDSSESHSCAILHSENLQVKDIWSRWSQSLKRTLMRIIRAASNIRRNILSEGHLVKVIASLEQNCDQNRSCLIYRYENFSMKNFWPRWSQSLERTPQNHSLPI